MTDLIERLRKRVVVEANIFPDADSVGIADLLNEAADEIEQWNILGQDLLEHDEYLVGGGEMFLGQEYRDRIKQLTTKGTKPDD